MKLVKEVMISQVITVKPDDCITEVVKLFRKKDIRGAPVIENGKVVGIISEKDLGKLMERHHVQPEVLISKPFDIGAPFRLMKAAKTKVRDIMTKKVVFVSPDDEIAYAAKLMVQKKINRLPVINGSKKLIGIITRGDILKAFCS